MKKDHSKLSNNGPEDISQINIYNLFVKAFKRLKIDF